MEQAVLEEEVLHAEELLVEESSHTRQPSFRDPATAQSLITEADIRSLRKRHSFLEEFSDAFIRSTPIGDLMKIETTSLKMKELERAKDASDRLAANKAALASTFTAVPEGRDNRSSSLHPARFLGGAAVQPPGSGYPPEKLWDYPATHPLATTTWEQWAWPVTCPLRGGPSCTTCPAPSSP